MHTFLKNTSTPTYIKYFISYLIVFTILILGFFFIIRTQITQNYFNQRSEQAKYQLNNFAEQLNQDILFLNQIDSSILSNEVLNISHYKKPQIYRYNLYKELTKYVSSTQLLSSIVYLSKEIGEVVSTKYQVFWEDETFLIVDGNQKTISFDPALYYNSTSGQLIFINNEKTHFLLYFPATSSWSNNIFFYILDINEIGLLQKNLVSEEMPASALVDADGQIVIGINDSLLAPYMNSIRLENGIYNHDSFSILVQTDISNGFSIIGMLSNDFLPNQMNDSFTNAYLALFFLSIAGILLIVLAMRITYLPLQRLTQSILSNSDFRQNYLHQLDLAFSETENQNQLLKIKLDNYRISIQKSLLNGMLSSQNPDKDTILPNIDLFFDINTAKKLFLIKIASFKGALPRDEIRDYYTAALSENGICILLESEENSAVFLINDTSPNSDKNNVWKILSDKLYENKGYYSAISNITDSPLDIPSLYANVTYASNYWSQFPVVEYQALIQLQTTFVYPHDELNLISTRLKEHNFVAARELINSLFCKLNHYIPPENSLPTFFVQCVLIDMLTIIANCINLSQIEFHSYNEHFYQLLFLCRSCPYQEKAEEIHSLVIKLVDFYEQKMANKFINSRPIRQVMEACYCQPDFSIAMLADKFQVSVTYMSNTFKKELNINFSDYLWMLRLNKAKELLLNTELTINEISTSVGYMNTTSFQRKFKQHMGVTPSQFRAEMGE